MGAIRLPAGVTAALDELNAAVTAIEKLDLDHLGAPLRLQVLEHMETSLRLQVAIGHDVIGGLATEDPADVGGPIHQVIADWLRITLADARRRIRDVEQLSPRLTLTGRQLPPQLPATAQGWRAGLLDAQHLRVIQTFVRDLPGDTPVDVVADAERLLAYHATQLRPDQLEKAAQRCAAR